MADPTLIPPAAYVFYGLIVAGAIAVYSRVGGTLRKEGGRVSTDWVAVPDLMVSIVLAGAFAGLVAKAVLSRPEKPEALAVDQLLPGAMVLGAIAIAVMRLLVMRKVSLVEVFGLRKAGAGSVIGWGTLLLAAGIPVVGIANFFSVRMLQGEAQPQPMVQLFRELAVANDFNGLGMIALAAVVMAPLCEETLFRGFFYPVGKRYLGPWISALVTALLFAAFHNNLAALPGLFILALCLNVAYERTGSIVVPMLMHALFNATSLSVLFLQATGKLPA